MQDKLDYREAIRRVYLVKCHLPISCRLHVTNAKTPVPEKKVAPNLNSVQTPQIAIRKQSRNDASTQALNAPPGPGRSTCSVTYTNIPPTPATINITIASPPDSLRCDNTITNPFQQPPSFFILPSPTCFSLCPRSRKQTLS